MTLRAACVFIHVMGQWCAAEHPHVPRHRDWWQYQQQGGNALRAVTVYRPHWSPVR